MARVVKGTHSFTCRPRVYSQMEWTISALVFPAEAGPHYRPRKDGRLSWPRHHHGEYTVCPGPLRDRNHSCYCLDRHVSLGNWSAGAMSVEPWFLGPRAATLTTEPPSHCVDCDLDPMTLIYVLKDSVRKMYPRTKMNCLGQRLESYPVTNRDMSAKSTHHAGCGRYACGELIRHWVAATPQHVQVDELTYVWSICLSLA